MASESLTSSRRRRRPTLACEPCRRKKIRCDRNNPCNQCTRSKSEYCVYLQGEDDGSPPLRQSTRKRSYVDQTLLRSTRGQRPVAIGYDRGLGLVNPSEVVCSGFDTMSNSGSEISTRNENTSEGSCCEGSSASETTYSNLSVRGVFLKSQFFGPSHWMNSVIHFETVHALLREFEKGPQGNLYRQCEELSHSILTSRCTPAPLTSNLRNVIPPREVTEQLIQAYLRSFESVLRILHVPVFLNECHNFWVRPDEATSEFLLQLLMVIAIGASFSPKQSASYDPSTWIHAVESGLSSISEKSRTSIGGVQILCLVLLARQINPYLTGTDLAGISVETLVRAAMRNGLHISPQRLPQISFYEQEIRRRLWATVLEISLQFSMEVGTAPLISAKDVDCEVPLNVSDEQFDQHTEVPPLPKPLDQSSHTSIQIALMQSLPVRMEIAAFVNNPRAEGSYQQTLQLGSRLSAYCKSNHARFNGDKRPNSQRFPVRLLDFFTYRFLLALHAPFALKASTDPTLYYSRKVSLEVSVSLLDRSVLPEEDDYARVMLVGSGIFAGVPILAASVVCAELMSQLEEEMSSFTVMSGSATRQSLHGTLTDYLDLLSRRMAKSTPVVGVSVLFAGLAAQIDAIQNGHSVEKAITEALQKSTAECLEMLNLRVSEIQTFDPALELGDGFALADMAWSTDDLQDWLPRETTGNDFAF